MGVIKLELKCPKNVDGITIEPNANWSFDALVSELNSLEEKIHASSNVPVPFIKSKSLEITDRMKGQRGATAFIMRVSDDEVESSGSEDEEDSDGNGGWAMVKRFNCDDLYISDDDSDYEVGVDSQSSLMDEGGLVEGALLELSHEHQLEIKEEIRNQISSFETELMSKIDKSKSSFAWIDKYKEARREMDKKLDTQYQRRVAEALENHLTAIQRDHELKSQIEERKIRNDAAYEEAKRKEKALQEEKLRQERARAEAEAKRKAEEAKMAALEAERRAKEAAEKEAADAAKKTTPLSQDNVGSSQIDANLGSHNSKDLKKPQSTSDVVRAAQTARKLEKRRLMLLEEWNKKTVVEMSSSDKDFSTDERHIARVLKQIGGTKENIRTKSGEITKIFRNSSFPHSCIAAFVKKVVSRCTSPANAPFASAHVTVLVMSQIPHAMDLLLAEFHKACIYTVPKHIVYSKTVFESKEAYFQAIGYEEDNGKIESTANYLKRLESYMKLYGALVQTEIQGISNPHGPKEGWAWLARFLNTLPANVYTAVALNAFLQAAGFVLFRKFRSQFMKLLNIISRDFLKRLRERNDSDLNSIIVELQSYIEDNKFLQEPEGRTLQSSLLSSVMVPDSEPRDYYYGRNY